MRRRLALSALLAVVLIPPLANAQTPSEGAETALKVRPPRPDPSTADHSKFDALKADFKSGPEVTEACLTCHTEAAKHVMGTYHWTWRDKVAPDADQSRVFGKSGGAINNFCISIVGNESRCTSCHAGYGWKDKSFDFSDQTHVDCLVCHADPKLYVKYPTSAGHPVYKEQYPEGRQWPPKGKATKIFKPTDLAAAAQSVAVSRRSNCGKCHFSGGGGENVKHGDLDKTLLKPSREIDVHMDVEGLNFSCQECHTMRGHDIAGRYYDNAVYDERGFKPRHTDSNLMACEGCHTASPHEDAKLNEHTDVVSCEACHIPVVAKKTYTKMWWDWSTSGELNAKGKPVVKKNKETGHLEYHAKKGSFIYTTELVPEYIWYDGHLENLHVTDKIDDVTPFQDKTTHTHGAWDRIDPSKPVVEINWTTAKRGSPNARI